MLVSEHYNSALFSNLNKFCMIFLYYFGTTFFQGSTGVKFSDVAGIDEAVEELQEVSYPYHSE